MGALTLVALADGKSDLCVDLIFGAVMPLKLACQCWLYDADIVVIYLREQAADRKRSVTRTHTGPVMILMDAFSCVSTTLV